MKECIGCGQLTDRTELVTHDDEYGMACSEPGIPTTTIEVSESVCHSCAECNVDYELYPEQYPDIDYNEY